MSDRNDTDSDARLAEFESQLQRVRPVTRRLIEAVMLDVWPDHVAIVDFGIDSQEHYEALYYPLHEGEILPLALDAALGHGEKLTMLTRDAASNPHKEVEFHTSWDVIFWREPAHAGGPENWPQTPGEIAGSPSEPDFDRKPPLPSPSAIAGGQGAPPLEQGNGQELALGKGRSGND